MSPERSNNAFVESKVEEPRIMGKKLISKTYKSTINVYEPEDDFADSYVTPGKMAAPDVRYP